MPEQRSAHLRSPHTLQLRQQAQQSRETRAVAMHLVLARHPLPTSNNEHSYYNFNVNSSATWWTKLCVSLDLTWIRRMKHRSLVWRSISREPQNLMSPKSRVPGHVFAIVIICISLFTFMQLCLKATMYMGNTYLPKTKFNAKLPFRVIWCHLFWCHWKASEGILI